MPKSGFRLRYSRGGSSWEVDRLVPGPITASAKKGSWNLCCHGEVIGKERPLTCPEVLERYLQHSTEALEDFDGAFVLVFHNESTGSIEVVTDRLNGMKCFVEETPEALYLVSSLAFLPGRERALDPIGLTSFLANGVIYRNRTVFEGVRSLTRACVHTFTGNGFTAKPYWEYRFDHQLASKSRKELCATLAELLLNAAKRRIQASDHILLSLSGGYDSTCVLGLLSRLAAPDQVECFSYVVNRQSHGSDEEVAAQMARIAGLRHTSVCQFDGDALDLIQRNALLGESRAYFCAELDAWRAISQRIGNQSVFFVGDECFGWNSCRLKSTQELLASIPIHLSSVLAPYSQGIDLDALGTGFDQEILGIFQSSLSGDLHDSKDFLYLDQRLGNVIMPWRELFAGHYAPVRNLLLDRHILDFMSQLPSSFRLGKNLYKQTVRMMFPELFRVRRAFQPAIDPFQVALFQQRDQISQELLGHESPLDQWVSPEFCKGLLPKALPNTSYSLKTKAMLWGKKVLKESALAHALKSYLSPKPLASVPPTVLLLRLLTLRKFLGGRGGRRRAKTSRIADTGVF